MTKICKACKTELPQSAFAMRYHKGRTHPYLDSRCRPCGRIRRKESKKRYATRHPEMVKAYAKKYSSGYRAKHREWLNKQCREWYHANKAYAAECAAEWRRLNPDRVRELNKLFRARSPKGYFLALGRKSYRKNHAAICEARKIARREGRYRHFRYQRRAKLKAASGHTNHSLLEQKLTYYGNRCRYCGAELLRDVTFDHAIPLSRGGSNWTANLLPACRSCNSSKNVRTFAEFTRRSA